MDALYQTIVSCEHEYTILKLSVYCQSVIKVLVLVLELTQTLIVRYHGCVIIKLCTLVQLWYSVLNGKR